MNEPVSFPLYDPEELRAQRVQLKWRALIACLVGLSLTAVCLDLGIQGMRSALSSYQKNTVRKMKRVCTSLETYHATHHKYPASLDELQDGTPIRDWWGTPLVYKKRAQTYILMSYGADGRSGGSGLNYDLSNTSFSSSQAFPSSLEIVAHPASRPLELGCLICGCLTAILTFQSITASDLTGRGLILLFLKVGVIGVAAFFISTIVLVADIPSGH